MEDWRARERAYRNRIAPYVEEYRKKQEQRRREERHERVRFWANLERRSPLAAERLPVAHRYILRPLQDRDFAALVDGIETRAMQNAIAELSMVRIAEYLYERGQLDDPALLAKVYPLARSSRPRRKPMPEALPPSQGRVLRLLTRQDWILLIHGQVTPRMADAIFEVGV